MVRQVVRHNASRHRRPLSMVVQNAHAPLGYAMHGPHESHGPTNTAKRPIATYPGRHVCAAEETRVGSQLASGPPTFPTPRGQAKKSDEAGGSSHRLTALGSGRTPADGPAMPILVEECCGCSSCANFKEDLLN